MDRKKIGFECEKAINFLNQYMVNNGWKKPALFHSIRVGTHLYEQGYERDIVVGGFLHDVLEDGTNISEELLQNEFGNNVLSIVKANSKNESLINKEEKKVDLINRCINLGREALIVKAGDVLDNFYYYEMTENIDELLNHCVPIAQLLLESLPDNINDVIFKKLESKMNETILNYS